MRLYAEHPALRARQLAADLGFLVWAVVWVLVARAAHGAVLLLAGPGRAVEDLGRSVAGSMDSAAAAAAGVPLVGEELAAPFDALSGAGGSVGGAGQSAQDAVGTLATVVVVLVLLPVGWLLLRWLPWRLRSARDAGAARRLAGSAAGLEVLAVRAAATARLDQLAGLPGGTGAAWWAGDPAATERLARLELRRLGLRPPT
ncbi:hypothetical protein E9549_14370 [Blastococcus sp. MG754426]|uniref:hypothetical protein n=1 Tax=unclassified Blastococcus TaxID=2619396 RepID=UPI001EF064F1|nr:MULTISPECIES: hypothetical protein [unclassified Blastococcus]MCF6508581.1 hypothetical protein [Blastococcus sp. MG754426]MCF6513159.1 hypothetical protein [Blastococcus sp. MG754427]MCF6736009.1 hypothetical protein [Blastococcus sp. KM273129]